MPDLESRCRVEPKPSVERAADEAPGRRRLGGVVYGLGLAETACGEHAGGERLSGRVGRRTFRPRIDIGSRTSANRGPRRAPGRPKPSIESGREDPRGSHPRERGLRPRPRPRIQRRARGVAAETRAAASSSSKLPATSRTSASGTREAARPASPSRKADRRRPKAEPGGSLSGSAGYVGAESRARVQDHRGPSRLRLHAAYRLQNSQEVGGSRCEHVHHPRERGPADGRDGASVVPHDAPRRAERLQRRTAPIRAEDEMGPGSEPTPHGEGGLVDGRPRRRGGPCAMGAGAPPPGRPRVGAPQPWCGRSRPADPRAGSPPGREARSPDRTPVVQSSRCHACSERYPRIKAPETRGPRSGHGINSGCARVSSLVSHLARGSPSAAAPTSTGRSLPRAARASRPHPAGTRVVSVTAAELWRRDRDLADACLGHPFVQGIASGELPRERFQVYVAQDACFLEAFARAYALALARCPDREGLAVFKDLLLGVFEELRLHRGYAERWRHLARARAPSRDERVLRFPPAHRLARARRSHGCGHDALHAPLRVPRPRARTQARPGEPVPRVGGDLFERRDGGPGRRGWRGCSTATAATPSAWRGSTTARWSSSSPSSRLPGRPHDHAGADRGRCGALARRDAPSFPRRSTRRHSRPGRLLPLARPGLPLRAGAHPRRGPLSGERAARGPRAPRSRGSRRWSPSSRGSSARPPSAGWTSPPRCTPRHGPMWTTCRRPPTSPTRFSSRRSGPSSAPTSRPGGRRCRARRPTASSSNTGRTRPSRAGWTR